MLLQICEPGHHMNGPNVDSNTVAVGIDLGTTHSLIGYVDESDGQVHLIPSMGGSFLFPSAVRYGDDGAANVGEDALMAGGVLLTSTKRLLSPRGGGIENGDSHDLTVFDTPQGPKTPVSVAGDILAFLKARAADFLGKTITSAVITVPAYFDERARAKTRLAARMAGIEVLRLMNEPTAAALAYGLDQKSTGIFAFYDFGGGTFDLSILRLEKGLFQVLATGGHTQLGGDDLDCDLARYIEKRYFGGRKGVQTSTARGIKEFLSINQTWSGSITIVDETHMMTITRDTLNDIAGPWIQKTLAICRGVLRDADHTPADLDGVVLVGGATRMPAIVSALTDFFGKPPLHSENPDEIVCKGAARSAHTLTTGRDDSTILLDVSALSLCLETMGGAAEKMIARNSPLPASCAQDFTTFYDGQQAMSFHVAQGESDDIKHCRSLGQFTLSDLSPKPAGSVRVRVTFTLDVDGLLAVVAEELGTGRLSSIEITGPQDVDIDLAHALVTGTFIADNKG